MPSGAIGDCGRMPEPGGDHLGRQPVDALAVEQHRAGLRLEQPGEGAQQRRLAARVGADDAR